MDHPGASDETGETTMTRIDRIQGFALSVTPPVGPVSSLGNMPVRNGVLIAITSSEGITGWGEIWCNFPPQGGLARLNLLQDVIGPSLLGITYQDFAEVRPQLEHRFARMMIHTGEYGPFAHCFAGIDTALADLAARRAGVSLSQLLGSSPLTKVPVYASAPNVADLDIAIGQIIQGGHRGVKLKIGNGMDVDTQLLARVAKLADGQLQICADANQYWTVSEATAMLAALSDYALTFVEEPLRADSPMQDWKQLARTAPCPIAAGENITSQTKFTEFMDAGKVGVVQPDVAKWGGVSGTMTVAQAAADRGVTCAMHYMGTGLGLAASLHCLAAMRGTGPMELDANPNPLRTELGPLDLTVIDGLLRVPDGPGHGFVPDPAALSSMSVATMELS